MWRSSFLSSFMDSLYRVRNKMIYVCTLVTNCFCAHSSVIFVFFFPSLLRNLGNKHQNNPPEGTETVCHSSTLFSTYICISSYEGII